MALNIAEGYGRYFYKENKNFNYYSRGSAFECKGCLRKALKRNLITEEENTKLRFLFEKFFKLINAYIKSIGQMKDQLQEPGFIYELKEAQSVERFLANDSLTIESLPNDSNA